MIRSSIEVIKRFRRSEDGAVAVEYAVLLSLILVTSISAVTQLGETVAGIFEDVNDQISNAAAS